MAVPFRVPSGVLVGFLAIDYGTTGSQGRGQGCRA